MDLIESSLSIIVFCLTVFGVVWVVRKPLELKFPKLKENKFWRELAMPAAPLVLGGAAGWLAPTYPYPELFTSTTSHVFFGVFCGLVSGLVYRLMKQNILKKIGKKDTPEESGPYTK